MITTLAQFLSVCEAATNEQIFEAFEDQCSAELVETIYEYSDHDVPEPFRNAVNWLGEIHSVQPMIDF